MAKGISPDRKETRGNRILDHQEGRKNSLQPHELCHIRFLCPPLSPRLCSNSCPLSQWGFLAISSSAAPVSFWLQSFPASGSFPVSWLFTSGGQSTGASTSASVLPMNIHGWFPLGLTGLIFLQSKGLSRVFSSTTIQKHQFFITQPSLWSNSHISMIVLANGLNTSNKKQILAGKKYPNHKLSTRNFKYISPGNHAGWKSQFQKVTDYMTQFICFMKYYYRDKSKNSGCQELGMVDWMWL